MRGEEGEEQARERCAPGPRRYIDILADCKPAITIATRPTPPLDRFLQHSLITEAIKKCEKANVGVRFFWVPSHDKKSENFIVPPHYTEDEMRHANKAADTAATTALEQAINASGIEAWLKEYKGKVDWATKALNAANAAGKQYEKWSLTQGSDYVIPPSTPPPTQADADEEKGRKERMEEKSEVSDTSPFESLVESFSGAFVTEDECILSQTYY